jgi:hypothetical protein
MTMKQTNAPVHVLADSPARRDIAPVETTQPQSIQLPESVVNDPRWRRLWSILLRPIEDDGSEAA